MRTALFLLLASATAHAAPALVSQSDPHPGIHREVWVDSAIPGKLSALDRASGDVLWTSPCEVGYGRGFGAGFGRDGEALLVGPSAGGHRIVRVSLATGELLDVDDVPTFDQALVEADLCLLCAPRTICAVDARSLKMRWRYAREGERYHLVARSGASARSPCAISPAHMLAICSTLRPWNSGGNAGKAGSVRNCTIVVSSSGDSRAKSR